MLPTIFHHITLSSALSLLVLLGYLLVRIGKWPKAIAGSLSTFVFNIAAPALLFNTTSRFSSTPPVGVRSLGMRLTHYGPREGWSERVAVIGLRLVLQQLVVWMRTRDWIAQDGNPGEHDAGIDFSRR